MAYLERVLDDVRRGNILIPRFQRRFVWRSEDRLKLLESVRDGIPIGSLLVWRTTAVELSTFPQIGGIPVPSSPQPTPGAPRQYLLDGHQRISTLFSALAHQESNVEADEEYGLVAGDAYYDLSDGSFTLRRKSQVVPPHWLPLNILFNSLHLLRYQRKLIAEHKFPDEYIKTSDALANRFRNYKIPLIPLVTDNLDAATTAFQRVNSSGMKMDATDMVAAMSFTPSFDLKERLDAVTQILGEFGWAGLDHKYILAVIRGQLDLDVSKMNVVDVSKHLRESHSLIDEAVEAIRKAALFLRAENIPSPEFLPYSYQIVLIAIAFAKVPEMSDTVQRLLRRWLWITTYTGFFRGARDTDITLATEEVLQIAKHQKLPAIRGHVGAFPARSDFRSARIKALAIRLADLQIHREPFRKDDILNLMADQGSLCLCRFLGPKQLPSRHTASPQNRFLLTSIDDLKRRLSHAAILIFDEESHPENHAVSAEALMAYTCFHRLCFFCTIARMNGVARQ
ncbi:MAG: DUF262 domain-containing protein [Planctomycetaceae bacterium]